jgi:hypothetical protein
MADTPVCDWNCRSAVECAGTCGNLPPRLSDLPDDEFDALLKFANRVQAWSIKRDYGGTFGEAAAHFNVPVERIEDAVLAHYWLFTHDVDRPLAERRIEHEGE